MATSTVLMIIASVLGLGSLVIALVVVARSYLATKEDRLVTCPDNHKPAAVHINDFQTIREALGAKTPLRLDNCSRWPEKAGCGQDCLNEVDADPQHCMVWNMVSTWYEGKSCAYCQKPFAAQHWHDRKAALLAPDHTAKQWNEVAIEALPEILKTHEPICWNCYIAETFRKQHPEMVLDRTWERGAGGEYVPKEEGAIPPAPVATPGAETRK